jgi:hypothetical protein
VIEAFAEKYRLKLKANAEDDGEPTINGKSGQVYKYSATELAVSFAPGLDKDRRGQGKWCPKTWGNFRRNAVALGMVVRLNGDSEGALSFDPANKKLAELALKIARVRQKQPLSPERLSALRENIAKAREIRVGA